MAQQEMVPTSVGSLAVRVRGQGPPVVLWHSLFVDERTWHRVEDELAKDRQLVLITGPGHGTSADPGRRYSMDECALAARTILDALGVSEPVDWVGNAWGGHVGLVFAATWPGKCRSLVTIGTPIQSYGVKERAETILLLLIYRLAGPIAFIRDGVAEVLLSPRTQAQDPAAVEMVKNCITNADRTALANAVVSISLRRQDLSSLLPRINAPTLFITGADHTGWTPQAATTVSQLLPEGSTAVVADAAYLIPLEAPQETVQLVREFWARNEARAQSD